MRIFVQTWGLVIGIFAAMPASATTFFMMDQDQLIRSSKAICFGEITSVAAKQVGQEARAKTINTLKIQECLKGNFSGEIKIVSPGGSIEISRNGKTQKIFQKVPGAPQFDSGWTGVVHLWWPDNQTNPQEFQVTSWQRGVMPMKFDTETNDFKEVRVSSSVRKSAIEQRSQKQAASERKTESFTLKDYREKVKSVK